MLGECLKEANKMKNPTNFQKESMDFAAIYL
jgi:hypothetical protein